MPEVGYRRGKHIKITGKFYLRLSVATAQPA